MSILDLIRGRRKFFSEEEEQLIVDAIQNAEKRTSGELKVYVESRCSYMDALDRAIELFDKMGLQKTRERNGVILYVAMKDHQLAIYGDEGIHEKVGELYWKQEIFKMIRDFNRDHYATGIVNCVRDIGEVLQHHFPYTKTDKNELSDDIEFGR